MNTNKILPLFNQESSVSQLEIKNSEVRIPQPQKSVAAQQFNPPYSLHAEVNSLTNLLDKMFPENRPEDKELFEVKKILGEKGKTLTSEQTKDMMAKIQYLVESWLDEYERQIFEGQTLNELLSSKQI